MQPHYPSFHMHSRFLPFAAALLLLTSCSGATPPVSDSNPTDPFSSSSSESLAETHNVSYIGTIRPAGISIYMEGTHRLELNDGRFLLLSSETVDLNGYVDVQAEVIGSVRPTVEEGGTIMSVEQIRMVESSSDSSAATSQEVFSSSSSSTSIIAPSAPVPPQQASSGKPIVFSSTAAVPASSQTSLPPPPPPADQSAQVILMAKQDLSSVKWTQAYCAPPTIGFCFPVHRNWYFMSFGAATQALWHVEVGSDAIEMIGQGPLSINLMGGALSTKGVSDKEVRIEGSEVIGYREWTKDRHIQISAPVSLKAAVDYITAHLTPAEEQILP